MLNPAYIIVINNNKNNNYNATNKANTLRHIVVIWHLLFVLLLRNLVFKNVCTNIVKANYMCEV